MMSHASSRSAVKSSIASAASAAYSSTQAPSSAGCSIPAIVICLPSGAGSDGSRNETTTFLKKMQEQNVDVLYEEELISRIEANNTVVEEVIATFVHQAPIDWLLPNVKPTNRRVTFPLVSISTRTADDTLVSLRLHWDQATVLRQIGALPTSLFCKANNSETVLPVLGPKIVDRLRMPINVAPSGPSAPRGGSAALSEKRKDSMAELINGSDVGNSRVERTMAIENLTERMESTTLEQAINNPTPALLVRPSSNDIFGTSHSMENVRPSSRVLSRPGGKSSDIFATTTDEDVAVRPVRTVAGSNPIFSDEPVKFSSNGRRDPNWSNVANDIGAAADSNASVTGARPSSRVIHRPGGPVSDIFGTETASEQRVANISRRDPNWSSLDAVSDGGSVTGEASAGIKEAAHGMGRARVAHRADNDIFSEGAPKNMHHIARRDPNARSDEPREGIDSGKTTMQPHGTGRAQVAHRGDTDIFNAVETEVKHVTRRDPNARSSEAMVEEEAIKGGNSAEWRTMTARRDHNKMSVQNDERPSSRVLRPPGGGSSFSFN